MGALQNNDWQGGIDEDTIRDAERLLDRASSATFDLSKRLGESRKDYRLYSDISINKAIAKIARTTSQEEMNEETRSYIGEAVSQLKRVEDRLQNNPNRESSELTTASTLGDARIECFYRKYLVLDRILNSPEALGIDYAPLLNDESYYCAQFTFDPGLSTTPDKFLIRNSYSLKNDLSKDFYNDDLKVNDSQGLLNFIYQYPSVDELNLEVPDYADKVILIQEPKIWVQLADQVSQLIEEKNIDSGVNSESLIIWRLLLSRDGEIITYVAYDDFSRSVGNSQAFLTEPYKEKILGKSIKSLEAGGKLEFADFKVVLSPEGKVLHILPWNLAYTTISERCQRECENLFLHPKIRSAFQRYEPDLRDDAELGALWAVVNTTSFYYWAFDTNKGVYFAEPGIFKLKVSSDGQVVDYTAINDVALDKLGGKIPVVDLKLTPFPALEKSPYAEFKLEVKGILARISPWPEDE